MRLDTKPCHTCLYYLSSGKPCVYFHSPHHVIGYEHFCEAVEVMLIVMSGSLLNAQRNISFNMGLDVILKFIPA